MKLSERWTDFRKRVDFAPAKVYRHATLGWEYTPIHQFGDEPGLDDPSECWKVDAWWGIDGDATLLESVIAARAARAPGHYVKQTSHDEEWLYLSAVIDAPFISRVAFEVAMSKLAAAGFPTTLRGGRTDSWLALDV